MQNRMAPIVLFVYNRPEHTLQTLQALRKNELADQSILYIFADGPKENATEDDKTKIRKVREVIRKEQWCGEVIITENESNKGLADSVIDGVTKIVNEYGKVIVLEDDLVTSMSFLKFMNEGLTRYENENIVKQVSGFFPTVNNSTGRSFFLPVTTTWGWATWKRVWKEIDFDPSDYVLVKNDAGLRNEFNLGGAVNYSDMLITQMESDKISSWGIRFWWNVFRQKGLVLYPDHTLVYNIGHDDSGTHTKSSDKIKGIKLDDFYSVKEYPEKLAIDEVFYKKFVKAFSKRDTIKNWIKRVLPV